VPHRAGGSLGRHHFHKFSLAEGLAAEFGRLAAGATGRNEEGSGLGLAIVTAIAEAHGGRVVLDSEPGHGATFTLVLPVNGPRA